MINPVDFEKMVDRKIDFLTTDAIYRSWASRKRSSKVAGIPDFAASKGLALTSEHRVSKKDIQRMMQLTLAANTAQFVMAFCQNGERAGKNALKFSGKIKESEMAGKTAQELLQLVAGLDEKSLDLLVFTWPTHPIAYAVEGELRRIISEKIKSSTEVDHALATLTFPARENTPVVENRKLMQISAEIAALPQKPRRFSELPAKIKNQLEKHVEKFGFLGARGAGLKSWSVKNIFTRALETAGDEELHDKIEKGQNEARENTEETKKIEDSLQFTEEQRRLVEAAKELVYFRTYRTEAMYHIYADIENLLVEIGKRFGYSLEQMQYLSIEEILLLQSKKVPTQTIRNRNSRFVILLENEKVREITGNELDGVYRAFEVQSAKASELTGTIACRGKVSGKAKIVLTSRELDKVELGDILITNMTTPDFVPAMQRAAAFVTNEGGITCHAAIVSREMNKPCIIATKVATKTFKDGDTIEVDAEKGIVRKVG